MTTCNNWLFSYPEVSFKALILGSKPESCAQMTGVLLGVALIDSLGRRPLLIWGSASCSAALILLFGGVYVQSTAFEIVAMCAFMLAFNASYAGVFWVLLSELFSMTAKSPAASAATAMMFLAGKAF